MCDSWLNHSGPDWLNNCNLHSLTSLRHDLILVALPNIFFRTVFPASIITHIAQHDSPIIDVLAGVMHFWADGNPRFFIDIVPNSPDLGIGQFGIPNARR